MRLLLDQIPARAALVTAAVLMGLAAGCEDEPVAPPPPPPEPAPFYPLTVGEAWTYDRARTVRFWALDGSGEVQPPIEFEGGAERELVTTEELAGVVYVVERQWFFADAGVDTVVTWRRYRQDDSGLYRAVLAFSIPPGSVPPVDSLSELTILRYPLAVGNEWPVSPGGATVRRVESLDTLATSRGQVQGLRIRVIAPTDGPNDIHREWYGTDGLLRAFDHTELLAMDPGSGETVRIVSDESTELLVRHE
jgi:hypothetical protein